MVQLLESEKIHRRGYALCVGIGAYTNLMNRNLRYAVADATIIAERVADPKRGDFAITVLTEPSQTTKEALEKAVTSLLSAPDRQAEDLALLYFSCHGDINQADHTFCLLPSNASLQAEGVLNPATLISIYDFARWFSTAKINNIVVLLDVCHSGGAGAALQQFTLKLDTGPNFFIIGAARLDQVAKQSSQLQHGLFTHCLLRAFEQPPTVDGWLTMSQIHTFISDELLWFTKEHPTHIQSWSVSVNPNMPMVRNPGYPELAPLPPVWNVPLQRNVFFTGQEELLAQLARMLQGTQKTALTQPHALSGLGGIGKTQLALEYAYRHRQDYHSVLWGNAESIETLNSTFLEIAHVLDLPQKDEPNQIVIVEAVKAWLMNRPQWLFILDNANDLSLIQEFLPSAFRGHLLLTTRTQTMGKFVGSKLEVEAMTSEMGALLLLRRAGMVAREASLEEIHDGEVDQAKRLAEELGGLPLALDQAGAYIDETQCSLVNYHGQYQERRAELLARRGGLRDDHPEAVTTTWSLSFRKIEQVNPIAVELLQICAFLAPDAIPEEVLKAFQPDSEEPNPEQEGTRFFPLTEGQFDEAVALLRRYSLVQRYPQKHLLSVHRLVQAVLQDAMPAPDREVWKKNIIASLNSFFPSVTYKVWEQCERFLPHALVFDQSNSPTELSQSLELASLLYKTGIYLRQRAQFTRAELLCQQALQIRKKLLGSENLEVAKILNSLGNLHRDQNKLEEAEALFLQAVKIEEKFIGPERVVLAKTLNNLALVYEDQGKLEQAKQTYQRVLHIEEQAQETDQFVIAHALNNLALIYMIQEQYEQAELLFQQALSVFEQVLGPEDPTLALPLNGLGSIYGHLQEYEQAELLLRRALNILEQAAGLEYVYLAEPLNTLAEIYLSQEKYEQAEVLLHRSLHILEKVFGPEYGRVADPLHFLANLYTKQGKYEQAEAFYQRAYTIWQQHLLQPTQIANGLDDFARFYEEQKRFDEALTYYRQVFAIRKQTLGAHHAKTVETHNHLIALLHAAGKHEEAGLLEMAQFDKGEHSK